MSCTKCVKYSILLHSYLSISDVIAVDFTTAIESERNVKYTKM